MRRTRSLTACAVLLYALAVAIPPDAQATDPKRGRLGAGLAAIAEGQAPGGSIVTRVRDAEQEIAVSVELGEEPGTAIRGRLRNVGLDLRGSFRRTIEGYVLPGHLERLAAVPGVLAVRAIRTPITDAFVGQAPGIHGALPWQQALYTGRGVKIGILDTSFDGMAIRLGTELPSAVESICFAQIGIASTNLADCVTPGENHGTAVAESIIDMAPNVSLYVSNARSPADLATAITWMTSAGVRVINYSLVSTTLLDGMGDGTSPYSNSDYSLVDLAVAGGALFVAAAGNSGETSWMGPGADANANGWLDFAPGDESNNLVMNAGDQIGVAIRWATAASDYDLSIWKDGTKLAESAAYQSETGDPLELLEFTAPSAGTFGISIRYAGGPAAATMRLLVHGATTALTYRTTTGSLPAPADSRNPGMVTVGAVRYTTPSVIEPYSSRGPTLDGRIKPDLVAVDCVDTTVAAGFCGTSQAAPFASGAAALLLEADPTLAPATLATILKQRAVPTGTPVPNNDFGYGLLSLGPLPTPAPMAASFLSPPATGTAAGLLLGQPTVAIVDSGGHTVGTGPGATMSVALSLASNPTGASLACEGGNTRTAVAGLAAFTGCSVDLPGSWYTLRADVEGLTPATSAPFSVAAAGSPPPVSMTLTASTVTIGAAVSGTVAVPPSGAADGSVAVEWSADRRVWSPASTLLVGAIGTAPFTLSASTNRWLRARMVSTAGATEVSPGILVRVNAKAILRSSIPTGTAIRRTTKITLTETIRPVGAGIARGRARFDFYLRVGTSWVRKRIAYANADPATGKAVIGTTIAGYGSWWIRSRAEPTTTNGASVFTSGFKYLVR
ncbi:MAG TPA: S8 family serine peptidase [Candidatus Sulfomarinibacteraceae bacterium]|nr:S8 family serine peptidase [Candidatus Sulfomarinibacteraceae bacterium]